MSGFKSFANKTHLEFLPGMTAIVGPNGCGKSNVSDALRWVLGEQSAKALRGSKMEDCIFNGTDARKPLGMAEVSVTFADCEKALGIEYDEVTITRRVFRSGEGQYFLNKTPCRLKDIQRLFMDTGVGTTSYSLMEQGRIDRILSVRPEDRRAVFEEASGITKFKADKKEAILKLEHTEANLLRLADVIREVKRQIGSLQRQAGKARRYKELRDELRKLDVYSAKTRLKAADAEIANAEKELASIISQLNEAQVEIQGMEKDNSSLRDSIVKTEREIGNVSEMSVQAESNLEHTRELIDTNRQRIAEYQNWSTRDSQEIEKTQELLTTMKTDVETLVRRRNTAAAERDKAEEVLRKSNETLNNHREKTEGVRIRIQELRQEIVGLESLSSRLHNELVEIEARERSSVIQRERLSAEKSQLARVVAAYEKRNNEMIGNINDMRAITDKNATDLENLKAKYAQYSESLAASNRTLSNIESGVAAKRARLELLCEAQESGEDFPGGTRILLDKSNPAQIDRSHILGALAEHLSVEADIQPALEAALRTWLDAVVVRNSSAARELLKHIIFLREGSTRLVTLDAPHHNKSPLQYPDKTTRLVDKITCDDSIRPLLENLIGHVVYVESLEDIPPSIPPNIAYVAKDGSMAHGSGAMEFWMSEAAESNPFSRKYVVETTRQELSLDEQHSADCRLGIDRITADMNTLSSSIANSQSALDDSRNALAQKEGESRLVAMEAKDAKERLDTVLWELGQLENQGASGDSEHAQISSKLKELREERETMAQTIHSLTDDLRQHEMRQSELQTVATENRVTFATLKQEVDHLAQQVQSGEARVSELERALNDRSTGVQSYKTSIDKLTTEIESATSKLSSLEETVKLNEEKAHSLRRNREKQAEELSAMEETLMKERARQDAIRNAKSDLEIRLAENRMRRQNQIDRVTSEYNMTVDQMFDETDPDWGNNTPSIDTTETRIAELRTKIEAMGPVNLVAIEEYKELEERYAFLVSQEDDLTRSKQQLMEMIRKINRTTSEMFSTTFEQVNSNFETMFKKLFNGGTAKLVLVNEEDVLECGIEIIARPPGKRLQNVTLLSGGERTMTAVALLFAIYMTKPSPFCLLDELDAALDDTNIGRFVVVLQEFLTQSQFIVITHNRNTIAAASTLYGVT
ncbi:MAG: chromosome segregation protein SMC, partial [Lentisphaerae bacterium]|nr:chromosome segregation protein SMC [Lentisphaerota bacterium]